MVEANGPGEEAKADVHEKNEEWSKQIIERRGELNYEQMVHLKVFEQGHLTFDKKMKEVPRTLLPGKTKELQLF